MKRDERKSKWWFSSTRYGDLANAQLMPAGTNTARSSFVTTIDHSETVRPISFIPPLPTAMAEMGRGNASRPGLVIETFGENNKNDLEGNRHSIASAGSDRSQYLIVHPRNSMNPDPLANTPMSVRPFSPSESFAFPKPPEPGAAAGSGPASQASGISRPTSSDTTVTLTAISALPGLPSLPTFMPLNVPNTVRSPSPRSASIVDPFMDNNPFDDPTAPIMNSFACWEAQVIRRPFIPTLPDELNVKLGDNVRVIHTFDDGWGMVEKVGKGKERGFIPMDCLRKPEEEFGFGYVL